VKRASTSPYYVAVEDVAAALADIESKGGQKVFGPHPIPDGASSPASSIPKGI
jgi:predicted enzyme related to lactoylglutathione lyase